MANDPKSKRALVTHHFLWIVLRLVSQILLIAFTCFPRAYAVDESSESLPTYKVESIEIVGSTRLTSDYIYEQLRISDATVMSDEWLSEARTTLLGLGVYKYVFFALRKGSKPGFAKLLITAKDDESVVSDWAAGGEFGLSLVKPSPDLNENSAFRGYRLGLVARNILNRGHRAALLAEIAADGNLALGSLAYGLPRFVNESIQFDAVLSVVDPTEKYFDTDGFGMKAQTIWTRQRRGFDINYGLVWYSNRHERYSIPSAPQLVSGPKIGIIRETRLLSFMPNNGYRASVSLTPSLVNRAQATFEAELARTFIGQDIGALTFSGKSLQVGRASSSLRGEVKYELPIVTSSHGLRSLLYISRRAGLDRTALSKFTGYETVAGYRYHSTGFIGDINFKIISKNPFLEKWQTTAKSQFQEHDLKPTGDTP